MLNSSEQNSHPQTGPGPGQDGYRRRYKDLKRKVSEMELENDALTLKLTKAKNAIQRLKLEKNMLFQRYKQTLPSDAYRSDASFSDIESRPRYDRAAGGSGSEDEDAYHKGQRTAQPPQPPLPAVPPSPNPPQHEKKAKKPKADPNLPKKPANAFFVYCEMHRGEIKDEKGGFSLGEATRILGQRWKTLDKESKQKYFGSLHAIVHF
ncbi:high mobility group box domain-containing protein [Cladochytrium replicatum]|nr:high mobility group box domain-containing protein [Cladochytrium replicatum]